MNTTVLFSDWWTLVSVVSVCFNADMFLMNLRAADETLDAFLCVLYDIVVIGNIFVLSC